MIHPSPLLPFGPQRRTLLACAAVAAAVLTLIALGHDGRRIAQLMALALPPLAWLAWPVRSAGFHRLRTVLVWVWSMAFVIDGAARAYLLDAYQAAPDSSLVMSATANTNPRESTEYLSMHWRVVLLWMAAMVGAGAVVARFAARGARQPAAWSRGWVAALCVLLLLGSVAYVSKSARRLHPAIFWSGWSRQVDTLRASWADQQQQRDAALARARSVHPLITQDGPSTLVLVITDSVNRDNMSLYGYQRATTPQLVAHRAQLGDDLLVLRNAWSVDASTLPSLRNMFAFGEPDSAKPQHLLALARAAGYKTWWMSNHDDVAIEQQHAQMADVVEMINRVPGRSGMSLDGELLDCIQEALEEPAERKLIVVHLMGAHPHYSLRFPVDANPFDDQPDGVEADLQQKGRSAWVRKLRQEYDAALLYHDSVVAETLRLTRQIGRPQDYRAWMYLSDHGQEVGHGGNHAGHSPSTASGYRIPTLVWRNSPAEPYPPGTGQRPFRADWAAWTMADLLNIRWTGDITDRNALGKDYRWVAPELPVKVESFAD